MNPLEAVELPSWAHQNRDMYPHLEALTGFAAEAGSIIELGVRGGVSTWALLDGLPENGRMWSVDIDLCVVPPRVSLDARWTFILGDDTDPYVQDDLPRQADLVFIDTSHEYEHTVTELLFALTRIPKRILLHDANWPGVSRAVSEFLLTHEWEKTYYQEASDYAGDFSLIALEPA